MEPILSRGRPGAASGTYAHDGEEFAIVLKGRIRIEIDEQEFDLERGDAVYFESRRPRRWTNNGPDEVEVLFVMTPPTW